MSMPVHKWMVSALRQTEFTCTHQCIMMLNNPVILLHNTYCHNPSIIQSVRNNHKSLMWANLTKNAQSQMRTECTLMSDMSTSCEISSEKVRWLCFASLLSTLTTYSNCRATQTLKWLSHSHKTNPVGAYLDESEFYISIIHFILTGLDLLLHDSFPNQYFATFL